MALSRAAPALLASAAAACAGGAWFTATGFAACEASCSSTCWSRGGQRHCAGPGGGADQCFVGCRGVLSRVGQDSVEGCAAAECETRCGGPRPTGLPGAPAESCWTLCLSDCEEMVGLSMSAEAEDKCIVSRNCTGLLNEEVGEVLACKASRGCLDATVPRALTAGAFLLFTFSALALSVFEEVLELSRWLEQRSLKDVVGRGAWLCGVSFLVYALVALALVLREPTDPADSSMLPLVVMARRFQWTCVAFSLLGLSRSCLSDGACRRCMWCPGDKGGGGPVLV